MNANSALLDSCEAARFSAFISEDMKMYPCSFMTNTDSWGDLRTTSLLYIWQNSPAFKNHRAQILNSKCGGCKHYHICNGGCVFMPEINQCKNKYSDLLEIV
jgi:radical SAM protein with 4Fe4S-binding SPASM domain